MKNLRAKYLLLGIITILLAFPFSKSSAQSDDIVQFSGKVVEEINGEPSPFPFVNVFVENSSRGTNTDANGFFSIAVEKGETIVFSYIGYQTAEYTVPKDLDGNWFTLIQTMTADTVWLPETVIYPWPSKEFFEIEFLALQPDEELQSAAEKNLSPEVLALVEERTRPDGNESADFLFRQQAQSRYYYGQIRPQRVFDAMAWKSFIEAWKRGDFKKKKKKKK